MFISKIGELLATSTSLEESFKEVLKVLYAYANVNYSFISLYDPQDRLLKIVASFGLEEKQVRRATFKSGEGLVGKAFKYGYPIVIKDLSYKGYLNKLGLRERLDEHTLFVAIPIRGGFQVLGVLGLFIKLKENLSLERALEQFQSVAVLLSLAYQLSERFSQERITWAQEREILTKALEDTPVIDGILGRSKAMLQILRLVKKIAQTEATVLITGESGTGKTLIAKNIHLLSERRFKPFIVINCSAIPENLLEAELFGYERGAFTGAYTSKKGKLELAHQGTIFLDEIGDLPLNLQPKLLRVLQDKEFERLGGEEPIKVDLRIIAATNRPLELLMKEGRFREDLYYRLNVVTLHLPPLRDRPEDIPLLVEYFLQKFSLRYEKEIKITLEALDALTRYHWPGNIRELENLLERLVILCEGVISLKDLPAYITEKAPKGLESRDRSPFGPSEKEEIMEALRKTGFVKSRAAKLLGLTLRQLDYRIQKYKISIPKF